VIKVMPSRRRQEAHPWLLPLRFRHHDRKRFIDLFKVLPDGPGLEAQWVLDYFIDTGRRVCGNTSKRIRCSWCVSLTFVPNMLRVCLCQYAGVLARYPATVAALDDLLERGTGAPVQLQGAYGAFRPLMTAFRKPRAN